MQPIIVRPAFTMGGTGGGICNDREELASVAKNGLELSPVTECLIERSIAGYKEIEFEVMRDHDDNAMIVCCMENFDPVGVHTGDSIVFSPSQTLSDKEYQMLRDCSLRLIRAVIGAGGVATVAAFKIVQNQDVFTEFMIASRRKEKCDI